MAADPADVDLNQPITPSFVPSVWSVDYSPECNIVYVKYKGDVIGRIQKASIGFDAKVNVPILNLEILVPGLVINRPKTLPVER